MKYRVSKTDKTLKGTIRLEGSKSITNRALIIKAMCPGYFELKGYSHSDDSQTLLELINSEDMVLDARDGGTTLRFILSFLAIHEGLVILTGSERLIERPIGPLVDALTALGADIRYLGKKGYPPVLVRGKMLTDNKVEIDAGISSQFISSLLMIAPLMKNGLIIKLKGRMVSRPFIQMTLDVMKHFGISYEWTQNMISIRRQEYSARDLTVEADWTAASYYYEMAAMADEVDLKIMGLHRISNQGDAVIAEVMSRFGVETNFIEGGVHLTKSAGGSAAFDYDFTDCPDLAQTVIATCAGMGVAAKIKGVEHLQIKETDRIAAMKQEIEKIGLSLLPLGTTWNLGMQAQPYRQPIVFDTYHDHRMAMSLAPLAMKFGEVFINDPEVVKKSYPRFWEDIASLGFQVEEVSSEATAGARE